MSSTDLFISTKFLEAERLTPLLPRINEDGKRKTFLLMGNFNINLLKCYAKPEVSEFFDNFS